MGVPGGRAICLTPAGPRAWQALDSPLWQASREEEAEWEEFGPSNPLLGSDGFTRLRTPGAASSRPRSAGSQLASLEAAKAAGEAARAAADAALAAAQLIVQETAGRIEPVQRSPRKAAPEEQPGGTPVLPGGALGSQRLEASPASMVDGFLRSLATSQDQLKALDWRMAVDRRPPVGVEAAGRWQHVPGEKMPPTFEEPMVSTLPLLADFVLGLQQATEQFDAAVSSSPIPSPVRRPKEKPLEEYCVGPAPVVSTVAVASTNPTISGKALPPSRSKQKPTTSNLAAMAAYIKDAPAAPVPSAYHRPVRSLAPVSPVKLPPLPQKTRDALEAAAMQPLYVKETFKLLTKPLKKVEEVSSKDRLPPVRSASLPSIARRPSSDRGKREASKVSRCLRSSRSTGSLC